MALVRTSLAQTADATGNTQVASVSGFANGDLLVVLAGWYNGGGGAGTCTISDSLGTLSWTQIGGTVGSRQRCAIFYAVAGSTTSGNITVTNSNPGDMHMYLDVYGYSGHNGVLTSIASTVDSDVNPPNDLTLTLPTAPASADETIGATCEREFSATVIQAASGWTELWDTTLTTAETSHFETIARTGSTSTTVTFDYVSGDEFNETGVAIVVRAATTAAATPMGWVARNARRIPVKVAKAALRQVFPPARTIPYNPPPIRNRRRTPVGKPKPALRIVVTPARRVFPPAFVIANRRRIPVPKPRSALDIVFPPSPPPTVTPALPWIAKNRARIPVARARSVYATTYEPAQQTAFVWVARNVTRIPVRKAKPALVVVLAPAPTVSVVGAFAFTLRNRRRTPVGKPRSAIRSGFYATPVVVVVITGRCWGWVEVESGNDSILGGTMPGGWVELEPAASEASGQTSYGYVEVDTTSEGEIVV